MGDSTDGKQTGFKLSKSFPREDPQPIFPVPRRSPQFEPYLVIQPLGSSLCGQCCIAMATELSLAEVLEKTGESRNYPNDLRKKFAKFGIKMAKKSEDGVLEDKKAVAFIKSEEFTHWIYWDGYQFLDPRGMVYFDIPREFSCSFYSIE